MRTEKGDINLEADSGDPIRQGTSLASMGHLPCVKGRNLVRTGASYWSFFLQPKSEIFNFSFEFTFLFYNLVKHFSEKRKKKNI